jgi:ubiquinone/menaquinone biosynthesis C-methylase UbiE
MNHRHSSFRSIAASTPPQPSVEHGDDARRHPSAEHRGHGPFHDLLAWVFFAGRRRSIYQRLAILSGARVGDQTLDVGCGDGYLTRIMAEAVGPAGTSYGVDPSSDAIAAARRRTTLANCVFTEGTAQSIDAPNSSYDCVVSSLMLHHLPEPDRPAAIAEMARVLRPGRTLLVGEFRPPTTPLVRQLISPVASRNMQTNPLQMLPPMLSDAGLSDIETFELRPWVHVVRGRKL